MALAERRPRSGRRGPGPTGAIIRILDALAREPDEYRVCVRMLDGDDGWADPTDVATQLSEEFAVTVSRQMVGRWRNGSMRNRAGHPLAGILEAASADRETPPS